MIIVTIFRWWYNGQFYFSFPVFSFTSNILEIPSEVKRYMFAFIMLKAFYIASVSESSYDRQSVSVHFTWRLIAGVFATELLDQGLLMASLSSVKASLGYAYMPTSWASKQEAGYIPTTLSDHMLNYFRSIFPPFQST